MPFEKIVTSYDTAIQNLFDRLLKEIVDTTPKDGFPYIEHDKKEIKKYNDVNDKSIDDLKYFHEQIPYNYESEKELKEKLDYDFESRSRKYRNEQKTTTTFTNDELLELSKNPKEFIEKQMKKSLEFGSDVKRWLADEQNEEYDESDDDWFYSISRHPNRPIPIFDFKDQRDAIQTYPTPIAPSENYHIKFSFLMLKFNHNYAFKEVHTYLDIDKVSEEISELLIEIFNEECYSLPTNTVHTNKKYSQASDFNLRQMSVESLKNRFLQLTEKDSQIIFTEKIENSENLTYGYFFHDLALEIQNRGYRILYPKSHTTLEPYKEDILICTDLIRMLYPNFTIKLKSDNTHYKRYVHEYINYESEVVRTIDKIESSNALPSSTQHYCNNLYDIETWRFLTNIANDIKDEINNIDFKFKHKINNSLQIVVYKALLIKYSLINEYFDDFLIKMRDFTEGSEVLNDSQLIQYIIDTYEKIVDSKYEKLIIYNGLKLTKKISNLFTQILINLLKKKKLEVDKNIHNSYIISDNVSNNEFEDLVGKTRIPIRNKNHDTFLDKESTYFLMKLLNDENVFLEEVSPTLLQKITEALTGYKNNQLRKLGNDTASIIKSNKKEKYDALERLLKNILAKIDKLKNDK